MQEMKLLVFLSLKETTKMSLQHFLQSIWTFAGPPLSMTMSDLWVTDFGGIGRVTFLDVGIAQNADQHFAARRVMTKNEGLNSRPKNGLLLQERLHAYKLDLPFWISDMLSTF